VILNCFLLLGFVLNIVVGIQLDSFIVWPIGNIPVAMCLTMALSKNHRLARANIPERCSADSPVIAGCRKILCLPFWHKFPVLAILCIPVLAILIAILLLFGQKPDSVVRAFTDTYHQGLSRLNGDCIDVVCGGHFLCTVAAKGHPALVKPIRVGERAGRQITCNRQLLVSNAFEELLEQRLPRCHRVIRKQYNRVGVLVHRYDGVFKKIWVADMLYLLMKPLEWIFTVVLYCCDRKPENRIARQYLRPEDRRRIEKGGGGKTGQ
jgi:hypothetical protein